MAIGSLADSRKLATMVFEGWLRQHATFFEGPSPKAEGHEDREMWRSQRVADWQDFRNLCDRYGQWTDEFDEPRLEASPLWQLAAMALSFGLPDELWSTLAGENKSEAMEYIYCKILAVVKQAVREVGVQAVRGLLTEPLTHKELAVLFDTHRNYVVKNVLRKHPHKSAGKKKRMLVMDMPPRYFEGTRLSIPGVTNRKGRKHSTGRNTDAS